MMTKMILIISRIPLYLKNGCPNYHGFYGQGISSGPGLQDKEGKYLKYATLNRSLT
jgi:hypothetical protein